MLLHSKCTQQQRKFIDQLNWGHVLWFRVEQSCGILIFVQSLKRSTKLRLTVAVTYSGLQPSGIYAMNANCFIDTDGQLIADCWLAWINREMFIESDKVVSNIAVPLSTKPALEFYVFPSKGA